MSPAELLSLMRAIARDLNAAGISGGPFGILRKAGGNQCGGYSCDVVCAGQGNSQRQWDVVANVGATNDPAWNGPMTVPNIRIDVCEVQ